MIKLLVKSGEESREVEYAQAEISIGRSSDNTLALADKKASRKHAKIEKVGNAYRVVDLGSGNGTKVNGHEVTTLPLTKGDEIRVGLTSMLVLQVEGPAAAKAEAARPAAEPPKVAVIQRPEPAAPPVADDAPRRSPTVRGNYQQPSLLSRYGGMAASFIIVGALAYGAWRWADKSSAGHPTTSSAAAVEKSAVAKESEAAWTEFKPRTETDTPTDALIAEAQSLADKFGQVRPEFEAALSQLKQKRSEQVGRMTFAQVDTYVQEAMREKRYGDAVDALKALNKGADETAAVALITRTTEDIQFDFKVVDDRGKRMADAKQYTEAIEHYRANTARFKGTEHFKYLSTKPDNLMDLGGAEQMAATAKASKPVPKPELEIAKAPAEAPKPVMEPPKPAMEAPKPAMAAPKPAMEAPKPAMMAPKPPPEPPKPPPPPPPPPKPAMEAPKPAMEAPAEGSKVAFKKPDVLCDCKKTSKGVYCVKCDRTLLPEDVRNGTCKRCEEKPKKIDMCVKRYFMADGKPETRSDKPVFLEGKVYDFPYEDRARIHYYCDSCQQQGDLQSEVKHTADCKNRLAVIKICSKSGQAPHIDSK